MHAGRLFVILITKTNPSVQVTFSGEIPCDICFNGEGKYAITFASKIPKNKLERIKNERINGRIKLHTLNQAKNIHLTKELKRIRGNSSTKLGSNKDVGKCNHENNFA